MSNELGNTPADKDYKPSGISMAESRALEAYPVDMRPLVYQDLIEQFGGKTEVDINTYPRCLFQEGYEAAEKDLALTWEDIKEIQRLLDVVWSEQDITAPIDEDTIYTEVFKRFKETKR